MRPSGHPARSTSEVAGWRSSGARLGYQLPWGEALSRFGNGFGHTVQKRGGADAIDDSMVG